MDGVSFREAVKQWAEAKGLLANSTPQRQFVKLREESTELYVAILDGNRVEIMDAIGDCDVVLAVMCAQLKNELADYPVEEMIGGGFAYGVFDRSTNLLLQRLHGQSSPRLVDDAITECRRWLSVIAEQHGMLLSQCRDYAWNQIKDRKGRTVDGIFVKEVAEAVA